MKKEGLFLVYFVLLLFFFGCVGDNTNAKNHLAILKNKSIPSHRMIAEWGDLVVFDYALFINESGNLTLYDTTNETLGRTWHLARTTYKPMSIVISKNNGMIPALNFALIGMKEGEEKSYVLSPEEAFGTWDGNKTLSLPLVVHLSKRETLPLATLYANNINVKKIKINDSVNINGINAKILNITNTTVKVEYVFVNESKPIFYGNCWRLAKCNGSECNLTCAASVGSYTDVLVKGTRRKAKVLNIEGGNVIFDLNNPLAGKWILLKIRLRKIIKFGGKG